LRATSMIHSSQPGKCMITTMPGTLPARVGRA
jgi:hypothetical protein